MSLPSELEDDINKFEGILDKIEGQLSPFFNHTLKDHQQHLTPLQSAKLNILVAYSLNSLFFMYLQTQGVSPHNHKVKPELDRIRHYITKLQSLSKKESGVADEKEQKPSMTIDSEASKRIIQHSLASNEYINNNNNNNNNNTNNNTNNNNNNNFPPKKETEQKKRKK
ncbi:hypothetical protein DFA_02447 [Cavenderia fasciculata]|uniref:Nuclear nucleic acid-binding protein C1D n=1 Tax=Cavenderia fasciculata TaxID=261658 RepID=F4PZH0_CACFS|nr:uncharacterized protein DFA_02447 [Cavenderia fasciculata]EGG19199.1 hypothetical protein DFA_02447 [Cavenderia fasciculata]|eukprot:XP_004366832.1 hypothetical protein DFA_02447 [Cavenderia fasciculata]